MPSSDDSPSRENLLWDYEPLLHFLARDAVYQRMRGKALSGAPTLSAQVYADVIAALYARATTPDKMTLHLEELRTFKVIELDQTTAEAYGQAFRLCLASARNRGQNAPETWFVWNVALHRLHGCRILTNDRARYAGLVASDVLA